MHATLKRTAVHLFLAVTLACGAGQASSISKRQGEGFLQMIANLERAGLPNAEELAFHLCDLASARLADRSQRELVRSQLETLSGIRAERDEKVMAALSGAGGAIRRNEYETAKSLYRLAAGQMLLSYLAADWDGLDFAFATGDGLKARLPELDRDLPGYTIRWEVEPGSSLLFLEAVPETYGHDGTLSFVLGLANGVDSLHGGDFGGEVVDLSDPRSRRLRLPTWGDRD